MPAYIVGTFRYADRVRVLDAIGHAVKELGGEKSDLSSTGATHVIVRVTFPEEPLAGHTPEMAP